jgi:voltage-gated potassium channel Kch
MSSAPHVSSNSTGLRWWFVCVTGVLTIVLGSIGFYEYGMEHPHEGGPSRWLLGDALYQGIQLLLLHTIEFPQTTNGFIEAGQWLGMFTFLMTTGMLLWSRLRQEIRLLQVGFWSHHFVICGLSRKGLAIMESIRERDADARIVAVDAEPAGELAERCHELGVCLIRQDALEGKGLRMARVEHASEIIAMHAEDEINIRLAAEIREYRKGIQSPPAYCRAHIANSHVPEALQKWTDAGGDAHTTLRFFDVFDSEARRVLLNASLPGVGGRGHGAAEAAGTGMAPIDGAGIGPADATSVHMVILGLGRMGSGLLVRAAKMGHFANGKKLRISVIDREAEKQMEQLFFRYPILAGRNDVCDVQMYEWQADSLEARQFIEKCAKERDTVLHVLVCLDNNARAVEIGLRLWEIVAGHPAGYVNVRINSVASVAPILAQAAAGGGTGRGGIAAFGMVEDTCSEEMVLGERMERLARAIHEEFVASRKGDSQRGPDDPALAEWARLREDFRESNRQQADHMGIKMRAIGCRIVPADAPGEAVTSFSAEEVEMLAQLEHRRWNAERWLGGWQYGKVTDKARRIHNCLVSWEELTEEIKGYDRETVRKLPKWLAGMKPPMKVVRG